MAQPTQEARKEALIRELAASRIALGDQVAILRHKLDVSARMKTAVRRSPAKWFGGSLAAGVFSGFLMRRRQRKKRQARDRGPTVVLKKTGFAASLALALAGVAKAAVRALVLEHVVKYVTPYATAKLPRR